MAGRVRWLRVGVGFQDLHVGAHSGGTLDQRCRRPVSVTLVRLCPLLVRAELVAEPGGCG